MAEESTVTRHELEQAISGFMLELGFGKLPVCMAKTQYSLSDDPALLGRPEGFRMNIREVYVSAGACFVVVLTGAIMTMEFIVPIKVSRSMNILSAHGAVGAVRTAWKSFLVECGRVTSDTDPAFLLISPHLYITS